METDVIRELLIVMAAFAGIVGLFAYARNIDPISGRRVSSRPRDRS
jgi:hypothetical protein